MGELIAPTVSAFVILAVAAGAGEVTLRATMQQVAVFVIGGVALAAVLGLARKAWKLLEQQRTFIASLEADLEEPARIRTELTEESAELRGELGGVRAELAELRHVLSGNGDGDAAGAWHRHMEDFASLRQWAEDHDASRTETLHRLEELRELVVEATHRMRYPWLLRILVGRRT